LLPLDVAAQAMACVMRGAHNFKHRVVKLGQLVKKKDPIVRQRDLPWRGISAATNQGNGTSIRLCGGMELLLFVVI